METECGGWRSRAANNCFTGSKIKRNENPSVGKKPNFQSSSKISNVEDSMFSTGESDASYSTGDPRLVVGSFDGSHAIT